MGDHHVEEWVERTITVPPALWDQAERLFAKSDTLLNTAIVLMLEAALRDGDLPFDPGTPNRTTAAALRASGKGEGGFTYASMDDAVADLWVDDGASRNAVRR